MQNKEVRRFEFGLSEGVWSVLKLNVNDRIKLLALYSIHSIITIYIYYQ